MRYFNLASNGVADLIMAPFAWENPWPALIVASFLSSIVLMLTFKAFSNQEAVRLRKGRLISRTLELLLFQHDIVVSLTACGRIFVANLAYLKEFLLPVVAAMILCVLILIQLECWYGARPFKVRETVLLEAHLRKGTAIEESSAVLANSDLLSVETEGVRIPKLNEVDWRLRARAAGEGWVEVTVDGAPVRKQIVVSDRLKKVSLSRSQGSFWNTLTHPVEPAIDAGNSIERIDVRYPPRELLLWNYEIDWLIAFFVLTMVFGLLLKGRLKVNL
jgi:hypothetical protein